MNRKKNSSIDQKMSMNETSATIMGSSLGVVHRGHPSGHYNLRRMRKHQLSGELVGCLGTVLGPPPTGPLLLLLRSACGPARAVEGTSSPGCADLRGGSRSGAAHRRGVRAREHGQLRQARSEDRSKG